jgi:ABC-type proline/glycine betaine transport system ATPase subunit
VDLLYLADSIILMDKGQIMQQGTYDELQTNPLF